MEAKKLAVAGSLTSIVTVAVASWTVAGPLWPKVQDSSLTVISLAVIGAAILFLAATGFSRSR